MTENIPNLNKGINLQNHEAEISLEQTVEKPSPRHPLHRQWETEKPQSSLGVVVSAMAWCPVDSLVRHLDIGLHAAVGVHAAVAPVEVDTRLGLRALVRTRLTLVNVCAGGEGLEPGYQATSP